MGKKQEIPSQHNKALYGIQHSSDEYCVFGGGIPIRKDGVLLGGIGVSGGTVEQDIDVAQAALSAIQDSLSAVSSVR